jgi:hypothetical protein
MAFEPLGADPFHRQLPRQQSGAGVVAEPAGSVGESPAVDVGEFGDADKEC